MSTTSDLKPDDNLGFNESSDIFLFDSEESTCCVRSRTTNTEVYQIMTECCCVRTGTPRSMTPEVSLGQPSLYREGVLVSLA